jgi:hypothetical protein
MWPGTDSNYIATNIHPQLDGCGFSHKKNEKGPTVVRMVWNNHIRVMFISASQGLEIMFSLLFHVFFIDPFFSLKNHHSLFIPII